MRPVVLAFALLALLVAAPAVAAPGGAGPGMVRVRLVTSEGPITIALDARHAPITTANFLAYVDQQRLDGTSFYRVAQRRDNPGLGFVEGGIGANPRRALSPIMLEPTSKTGLHHVSGTISMARYENLRSATANFSILVGSYPALDASPKDPGFAAFGHVIAGMAVVKHILGEATAPGSDGAHGETLLKPVAIIRAVRLDGKAGPAPGFKPWLLKD